MMKKILLVVISAMLTINIAIAKEGMWLPMLLKV